MDLDGLSGLHENSVLIFAVRDILGKHRPLHQNNLVKKFCHISHLWVETNLGRGLQRLIISPTDAHQSENKIAFDDF